MAGLVTQGDDAGAEALFGRYDVTAASGNGGLTVCVNAYGQVASCRWPSPGYHDQISYEPWGGERKDALGPGCPGHPAATTAHASGLTWGIRFRDRTLWPVGEAWQTSQAFLDAQSTVIETQLRRVDSSLTARQLLFVHPTEPILAARLEVRGAEKPQAIYWYADFTPCTRLIPELPVADWALDDLNDFAVFAWEDGKTVCHFRPEMPSSEDWEQAEALEAMGGPSAEWLSFDDGVWIACASPEHVLDIHCGNAGIDNSALAHANSGKLGGAKSAVGQCDSVLALEPVAGTDTYTATVFVAFGDDSKTLRRTLDYAIQRGYDTLLEETAAYWRTWIGKAALPVTEDAWMRAVSQRCLLAIAVAMDKETGAIVRAPITRPPMAVDLPRDGAWPTLALDLAGYQELAEQHCLFYVERVRMDPGRGMPRGSLPAALYADGGPAAPHLVVDVEGPAWMLWSLQRHLDFLDEASRPAYLDKIWQGVDAAAAFLVGWTDARTGEPIHSFDPVLGRDTRDPARSLTTYIGLTAALEIATAVGEKRPEWEKARRLMADLVRAYCLDQIGRWQLPAPPMLAPQEFLAKPDLVVGPMLKDLEQTYENAAARMLCAIALIGAGHPGTRDQIQAALASTLGRALGVSKDGWQNGRGPMVFPDAINASLCFIAMKLLCEPPPN